MFDVLTPELENEQSMALPLQGLFTLSRIRSHSPVSRRSSVVCHQVLHSGGFCVSCCHALVGEINFIGLRLSASTHHPAFFQSKQAVRSSSKHLRRRHLFPRNSVAMSSRRPRSVMRKKTRLLSPMSSITPQEVCGHRKEAFLGLMC